jgi:hypothetical protein
MSILSVERNRNWCLLSSSRVASHGLRRRHGAMPEKADLATECAKHNGHTLPIVDTMGHHDETRTPVVLALSERLLQAES